MLPSSSNRTPLIPATIPAVPADRADRVEHPYVAEQLVGDVADADQARPAWAPSTGPISEMETDSPPKIARHRRRGVGRFLVADVLDHPGVGPASGAARSRAAAPPNASGCGPARQE